MRRSTSNSGARGSDAADSAVAGSGAAHSNLGQVWGPQPQLEGADGAAPQHEESAAAEAAAGGGSASWEETAEELTATGCESGRGGNTDGENPAAAAEAVRATAEDELYEARESATSPGRVFSGRRETLWSSGRATYDQQGSAADRGVEYGDRLAAAAPPSPHADTQLQDPDGQHRRRRSTVQIIQKKEKECYCVTEVDYIPRYWTTDLMCCFATRPQYILLIKRINSPLVTRQAAELATFLVTELNFTVLVEPAAAEEMAKATSHAVPLKTWSLDGAAARTSGRTSPVQCAAAEAASQREARVGGTEVVQPTREAFGSDSPALAGQRPQQCRGAAAAWDLHGRARVLHGASASAVADQDVVCHKAFASAPTVASRPVDGGADTATPSSRLAAAAVSATKNAAVRHTAVIGAHVETRGASSSRSASAVHRNVHTMHTSASTASSEKRWPALTSAAAATPLQTQRDEHNVAEATGPAQQQTPQLPIHCYSSFRSGSAEENAISSPGSTDTVPAGPTSSAVESPKHLTRLPGAARVHVAQQFFPLHSVAATAAAAGGAAETLTAPTTQSSSLPGSPLRKRETAATSTVQSMASVTSSAASAAYGSSGVATSPAAAASASAGPSPGRISRAFTSKAEEHSPLRRAGDLSQVPAMLCDSIDLVVALGGDGTMLWVSQLFAESVPPVLGVAMGTLGYLTRFTLRAARRQLRAMAACKRFSVNLRCRLKITLTSKTGAVLETFVAFNECVIDRGHSSNLCSLDVFCNGAYFTTVAADGLILATPTGSTAYSMSAGGSMVHPKVPCLLFTPICPHTLSFRPVILPDSVELRIVVPEDARGSVWIAVDGRSRTQVEKGMQVLVSLSAFPFPMVTRSTPSSQDVWLESLKKTLNWNCRVRQGEGPGAEVEKHGGTAARSSASSSSTSSARSVTRSTRRSRDSSTSDSNDSEGGTREKKGRRNRCCNKNNSSKGSSKRGAGGSGRARKTCESCRDCGHCRRNRSSSGSRSSTGGGGYGRNRKERDVLPVAGPSCKTSAKGLDREIAGHADREEQWQKDGTYNSSFTRSQSVAAAVHKFSSFSVSPTVLRPPRCFRRGMQRRSVQRGGSSISHHRKSSSPSSNDSHSSSRRSGSRNEMDTGSTDRYGVERSPHSNRKMRGSHSRKWTDIGERSSVLQRGEKIDAQERRASSRHAKARHLAAAGQRTAAAEAAVEEDGRRVARGSPWIGAATVGARECQPAQQQHGEEVSKPGPPAVRARRRISYMQGGGRKNLYEQHPGTQAQIFSTVLSETSAARPPRAALHCLSRTPAGNAAAAVAAAAPAVAAVAAVSSSPEASGAPASRRLPTIATFISLPAAAAAAARAEEQQAAGVAEQVVYSANSPLHKQIFLCDEQLVLPDEHTLLKYATADDAAAVQETERKETRLQEAEGDTDTGEPCLQPQQLVLPIEADGLSSEALVSDYPGAQEQQSRPQQQYSQQQLVQQHRHEEQQQALLEGERQGQQQTGNGLQAKQQQRRAAQTVSDERRHDQGSTRAGEATKIVTAVTGAAAGEGEEGTAFVPVSALLRYPDGCIAAAAAAVLTPPSASRSSSARHRRSPHTAATVWERSTAEGYSLSPKRLDEISFAAVEHHKREKRRCASSEKQRRSVSSDWPGRRQQRALPSTYPLQPCWTLSRVYTVKSWLPSWSPLPPEAEGAGETATGADGTAVEKASLFDDGRAPAGQSLAAGLPGEHRGRARGRRAATVGSNGRTTAATEAVVLMHKTPGSADTAVDTVYVSPCIRSNHASADLPKGFRSMGFSSSNFSAKGSTSGWKVCRSKRETTKIFLGSERNNTAAHSHSTDSHRVGTARHQGGGNSGVAGASVVSREPSCACVQSAHSQSGAHNALLSDLGKPLFAEHREPVEGPVLAAMSRFSLCVGCSFPAALPKHAAAIPKHTCPTASTEHTLPPAPAAVCDHAEIGMKYVAVDGGGAGEGAAMRTAQTSDKASAEQQLHHRRNNLEGGGCLKGETSLQEPRTTGGVRQEGSGRGRENRAQAQESERELPAADALPAKNAADPDRAAAVARKTRGTEQLYSERISPGTSRGPSNSMHSRSDEVAVNSRRSSRVASLRKCFQIDRRAWACRFLRPRHRYSHATVHGAILLLRKRRILDITQGHRSVRPAVSATAELTISPPPRRCSPPSCPTSAAICGLGDSAAVARFTPPAPTQRCSRAVTDCCCGATLGPFSSITLVNPGAHNQEDERERHSTEQSAAAEVVAESRSRNCHAWQAAEAQFSGLEQTERCASDGVAQASILPLFTHKTRRRAGDVRKTSLPGRRAERLHTDRSTHWEQVPSNRAAVYLHRGGLSNTCAVFGVSKRSSPVFPEQSHRRPSSSQSFSCDDVQNEQQNNLQREKGTQEKRTGMRQESGSFTGRGRGDALQKDNGKDFWRKNENGLLPKEQRGSGQKETKSHDSGVAPDQEEQHQQQDPLQRADARACTREEGVLREAGGQTASVTRLTNEAARSSPAVESTRRADTAAVQQQQAGHGRRDFQERQHTSRVTTTADAQAGILAEDATSNVSDGAFVVDTTAPPWGSMKIKNSIASGQLRPLTCTTTLEKAASAACATTSRAVRETCSRTGSSRAPSEAAGRTAAEEAGSKFSLSTGAAGAGDGAAVWRLSLENASPVLAVDSCSNSPPRARKAQMKPVHVSNVVSSSSGKGRDCDSTPGLRTALEAVLPQAVFKHFPDVGHKPAEASKDVEEEEERLRDVESSLSTNGRGGVSKGNCISSETCDSSYSRASHSGNNCSGPTKNSNIEPVTSSDETADRKNFLCRSDYGKARYLSIIGASKQTVRPGTSGKPSTIHALSEQLIGKQEGPQKDSHECGAASDASMFRVGYGLAEAGNETPLPQPKGEPSDTSGPASGESSPRSLTSASLALHPPEPPIFPAHELRAHPPSFAGSASASPASSPCSGQKKSTRTAGYAGVQREQHYTEQTNIPTAVAVDVSFSWPQHREQQLEQRAKPRPSSHISVEVTRTARQRYPPQSSRAEQKVETIEEAALVGFPVFSKERVMQRRNTGLRWADDTPQENSEDAAARCEKRNSFRRCTFSAATLVSDAEAAAEEDGEPRGGDTSLREDKLKSSRTLSSLRPSSGVGGIMHGKERTRSVAPSTSVFMLPTDRCTAVVRLVSSASRTSLELFRDVREVTAASASASLSCPVDDTTSTSRTLQHT